MGCLDQAGEFARGHKTNVARPFARAMTVSHSSTTRSRKRAKFSPRFCLGMRRKSPVTVRRKAAGGY